MKRKEDVVNKLTYVVVIFFDLYLHWQEDAFRRTLENFFFAIFKSWTYTLFDNMNQGYTRFTLCCSVVLVLRCSELNRLNNRTRRRGIIDFNMKPCNITWLLDGPLRVIKLQSRFKVFNISYLHVLFHSS